MFRCLLIAWLSYLLAQGSDVAVVWYIGAGGWCFNAMLEAHSGDWM